MVHVGPRDDYDGLQPIPPEHYVVGEQIAAGGMGRIRVARDRRLGREVALKELLVETAGLRARFEREARITAKLQHPSIVSVLEAGAWPSGEPFFAMKLVSGQSLDVAVAARTGLNERLGLLPNVIAVVDALAYAHSRRVIHRDLKPGNVLVGEFGETVVIDWGLAKDLGDAGAPDLDVGPYRTPAAPLGKTVAGSVLGTPAYMAVEQARGETVDERADVHALGALLYHVLTGTAPYAGHQTSDEVVAAVIAGPPVPLAELAPGVAPDLVTIVERAMAREAADRYPTAQELAADLKKFQTGQLVGSHRYSTAQLVRRWLRRHRTAVTVAAVAALVLVVAGAFAIRRIVRAQAHAEAQRVRAEQSRADAEDLVGFMLVDLRNKLRPLGKLEVLDDVAQKAIAYYDARGEQLTRSQLVNRALARRNLGEVLAAQGHNDQALVQYRESLAITGRLVANEPENLEAVGSHGASQERLGDGLIAQGDVAGALVAYRAALEPARRVAEGMPGEKEKQNNLATAHVKVGDALLKLGDSSAALGEFRASLAVFERLAAEMPEQGTRQYNLSIGHERVGDILLRQGDRAGALASYREKLAIMERLAAREPRNADWALGVSVGHNKIADVLLEQGDADGALAAYRASLAIRQRLSGGDPKNAELQRRVAVSQMNVGNALRAQGALEDALAAYRASLAGFEKLAAVDPANVDRQQEVAFAHERIAQVYVAQHRTAEALASFRRSLEISLASLAADPSNVDHQTTVAGGHDRVGDMLLARGDPRGALAEYRVAHTMFERLASLDPRNAAWAKDVASLANKVATCCGAASGDPGH